MNEPVLELQQPLEGAVRRRAGLARLCLRQRHHHLAAVREEAADLREGSKKLPRSFREGSEKRRPTSSGGEGGEGSKSAYSRS